MTFIHCGRKARTHVVHVMLLIIAAASPFASTARAQTGQTLSAGDEKRSRTELVLSDVYRLAATNPRVRAATALAEATQARVASARRPSDPELQLGFMNRSLPSLAPMDPLGMTQLQVMQMIPTPGKLGLAGRIASENAAAARARVSDVRWDVRARAAMTFYDLYASDGQVAIARQTKKLVQEIAKVSQVMYSVGDGKQADVLRAQVEVARMTEDITRMESMRVSMAGRLSAILGLPEGEVLATPTLPDFPETLPPLNELTVEALRSRPMIAAGERDLSAAEAGQRLARKEIWPDLQVGIQYGWRAGEMGTERMGSLMLGATIPVYARSRQLRMRSEADAMRAMSAADLAAMRAETRGRMTELYADFARAKNLRTLYRTTVLPQAEGAVTASFSAYRVGDVNLMTLLDNQMTVNRYRQQVIELEAEQGKAIAEIEVLLGRELFDASRATALNPRRER
jgi:cobalt-zinc-cadmium efflux system outer membrane protein